uniref:Integrin-linked kinase-associated serine/threonine phosphatase 2C-like n=1 Tax=Hirondellea gigas TaxID=1518452 RepID=A0A6A7G8P3_9CRUS
MDKRNRDDSNPSLFADLPTSSVADSSGESSKRRRIDDKTLQSSEENDSKHQKLTNSVLSLSELTYDVSKLSKFQIASFSDKGKKPHMEDRKVVFADLSTAADRDQFAPFRKQRYALFAIYDGHGGGEASEFLQTNLHRNLIEELISCKDFSVDGEESSKLHQDYIRNAFTGSFRRTDKELLDHLKLIVRQSGSTGVVCMIVGQTVWTANVGDSKAVLARLRKSGKIKGVSLSKDHHPILLSERKRIDKSGGFVRDGRVLGRLEVSRSFGDPSFKSFGVVSTPYISRVELSSDDQFLIIGCDGLWSHFPVQDAVDFVYETINHYSKPDIKTICRKLVREAVMERGAPDNVTAILVILDHQ